MLDWPKDTAFVEALERRQYLGGDGTRFMAEGVYLYLYEAWCDGILFGVRSLMAETDEIEAWRVVVELWKSQKRDLKYLEVPPEIASQLGVPMEFAKVRRRESEEEDEETSTMTKQTETVGEANAGSAQNEPTWKKRKEFDGTTCGYVGCTHDADGYVQGTRSTKEGANGRLWYGPACTPCVRKWHQTLVPMSLAQLAAQRTGASDLAGILDLEVGEVLKRLDAAGIDEKGQRLTQLAPQAAEAGATLAEVFAEPGAAIVALEQSYTIAVVVPFDAIEAVRSEMTQTLAGIAGFVITNQEQMDYASSYLQRVKGLSNEIDAARKAISKPFRKQVEAIQTYFKPALDALSDVEKGLKARIQAGYQLAQQTQAVAFQAAEAALAAGNVQQAGLATQSAIAADLALPKGLSMRSRLKWEVVDPSQVPGPLWSIDAVKVDAAIDAGHREIPGIRIWEDQSIAARAV